MKKYHTWKIGEGGGAHMLEPQARDAELGKQILTMMNKDLGEGEMFAAIAAV